MPKLDGKPMTSKWKMTPLMLEHEGKLEELYKSGDNQLEPPHVVPEVK